MSANTIHEIDSILKYVTTSIKYTTSYIEKYAIIKKGSHSEGVLVYGVPEKALNEIFQLDQFSQSQSKFHNENDIIIGSK